MLHRVPGTDFGASALSLRLKSVCQVQHSFGDAWEFFVDTYSKISEALSVVRSVTGYNFGALHFV